MSYFPMLVNLEKQKCLIVGGGKVALRKLRDLQAFGATVTVLAPEISEEIRAEADVLLWEEKYEDANPVPEDFFLVVAASSDPELNHEICEICREKRIPVNSADGPADSTFIVPAYVKQNHVVAAFSGGGDGPVIAQYLKKQNQDIVTPWLGEVGEYLGNCRAMVKDRVKRPADRKRVYETILSVALTEHRLMSAEEIFTLADTVNQKSEES